MDIRTATMVVNFDVPRQKQEFIHRAGRAGRQGREGIVVSLEEEGSNVVEKWVNEEGWKIEVF